MTYKEALSVFSLETLDCKDKKSLTKYYRKLARKWHPDLNHSPEATKMTSLINEAYDILSNAFDTIKRLGITSNVRTIIISLEQLIEMYDTGSTANGKITSAEMIHQRSFVNIDGTMTYNGITYRIGGIVPFRQDNNYTVHCEIPVVKFDTEEKVRLRLLSKDVNINIKYESALMRLKFGDRIIVNVEVSKQAIREDAKT